MEIVKRRIIFWTLTVLFILTAVYVVFYARGYRFDLKRGIFVHSGTITIKSNPQEVDVEIDGEAVNSKKLNRINGSYSIAGLTPKGYELTISAEGFKKWSKKIDVHSGLSTEFWNIVLVKEEYEKSAYDAAGIRKFFISPKSKRLVFVQDVKGGFSMKILNIKNNVLENDLTFARWNFIPESKKENIEWSPEEDYLSVPVQKAPENTGGKPGVLAAKKDNRPEFAYFIVNPNTNEYFNLNDFLNMPDLSHVRWDPKDKKYLFFLNNNSLYRANVEDKNDVTLIAQNVSNFDLSKTNVYYLQLPNQLVFKIDLDGQSGKTQVTKMFPSTAMEDIGSDLFVVYDDARIAFLNKNKELFVFNDGEYDKYFNKLADNVEGLQFSDDGKKLLYWTKNEISVHFLRNWGVQPFRFENSIENITRYSEELGNVQWFNEDYEHVIFSAEAQVKIIELDPRGHRNYMDLIKTDTQNSFLIYNNTLGKLLFIDEKEASNNLFSIDFPEKTTILGF